MKFKEIHIGVIALDKVCQGQTLNVGLKPCVYIV